MYHPRLVIVKITYMYRDLGDYASSSVTKEIKRVNITFLMEIYMNERELERHLVNAVRQSGGIAPKFVSPGYDGMPDRIILLPGGRIAFVEVKAMGRKPRLLQLHRHEMLKQLGFKVFVLDDGEQITPMLMAIGGDP